MSPTCNHFWHFRSDIFLLSFVDFRPAVFEIFCEQTDGQTPPNTIPARSIAGAQLTKDNAATYDELLSDANDFSSRHVGVNQIAYGGGWFALVTGIHPNDPVTLAYYDGTVARHVLVFTKTLLCPDVHLRVHHNSASH